MPRGFRRTHRAGIGSTLLTLRLDAYNVADEHYWPNAGYVSDPRTLAVSANLAF